ncbi:unnamed protein product, partial [Urochloa humidicola]
GLDHPPTTTACASRSRPAPTLLSTARFPDGRQPASSHGGVLTSTCSGGGDAAAGARAGCHAEHACPGSGSGRIRRRRGCTCSTRRRREDLPDVPGGSLPRGSDRRQGLPQEAQGLRRAQQGRGTPVAGMTQRFCQMCSRFHPLAEFDGLKRSCRRRLTHARRRARLWPPGPRLLLHGNQENAPIVAQDAVDLFPVIPRL